MAMSRALASTPALRTSRSPPACNFEHGFDDAVEASMLVDVLLSRPDESLGRFCRGNICMGVIGRGCRSRWARNSAVRHPLNHGLTLLCRNMFARVQIANLSRLRLAFPPSSRLRIFFATRS